MDMSMAVQMVSWTVWWMGGLWIAWSVVRLEWHWAAEMVKKLVVRKVRSTDMQLADMMVGKMVDRMGSETVLNWAMTMVTY